MKHIISFIVFCALPAASFAQDVLKPLTDDLVVMIDVPGEGPGSGFIVGEDEDRIYLGTAFHVVDTAWDALVKGPTAAAAVVRFPGTPEHAVPAFALSVGHLNVKDDFAVLAVRKIDLEKPLKLPALARIGQEELPGKLIFLGRRNEADWQQAESAAISRVPNSDTRLGARMAEIRGFSGGPVFDGFLRFAGMTVEGTVTGADNLTQVLSATQILQHLKKWQIPMADYLLANVEGPLPPNLSEYKINGFGVSYDLGGIGGKRLTVSFQAESGRWLVEPEVLVMLRTSERWEPVASVELSQNQSVRSLSREFALAEGYDDLFICLGHRIQEMAYAISIATVLENLDGLRSGKASLASGPTELRTLDKPCAEEFRRLYGEVESTAPPRSRIWEELINEGERGYWFPRIRYLDVGYLGSFARPAEAGSVSATHLVGKLAYLNGGVFGGVENDFEAFLKFKTADNSERFAQFKYSGMNDLVAHIQGVRPNEIEVLSTCIAWRASTGNVYDEDHIAFDSSSRDHERNIDYMSRTIQRLNANPRDRDSRISRKPSMAESCAAYRGDIQVDERVEAISRAKIGALEVEELVIFGTSQGPLISLACASEGHYELRMYPPFVSIPRAYMPARDQSYQISVSAWRSPPITLDTNQSRTALVSEIPARGEIVSALRFADRVQIHEVDGIYVSEPLRLNGISEGLLSLETKCAR